MKKKVMKILSVTAMTILSDPRLLLQFKVTPLAVSTPLMMVKTQLMLS